MDYRQDRHIEIVHLGFAWWSKKTGIWKAHGCKVYAYFRGRYLFEIGTRFSVFALGANHRLSIGANGIHGISLIRINPMRIIWKWEWRKV